MTPNPATPDPAAKLRRHWNLDPEVLFLNHGSFGACPEPILKKQSEWARRLEREPVLFMHREIEGHLEQARDVLAKFVGAKSDDLAFVVNATAGVNTVLRSLKFAPGDELLTTDQEYNASRNALDFVAQLHGAQVTVAAIPFPIESPDVVVERILAKVTAKTRLALVDHVSSPTGLVFPIEKIVRALAAKGVDTLVDGAHGPGQLELELDELGAAYYTGNCHKWLCTPKGSALLHVRRDRQERIRPLSISHGANSKRTDRSRFRLEFDWPGTFDPTPWLVIPDAIEFLGSLFPGGRGESDGFAALRRHNHELAMYGRAKLLDALQLAPTCPESMVGSLAAVVLPERRGADAKAEFDPLHLELFEKHHIEVPLPAWPAPPKRLLRISAQAYNVPAEYERLAALLPALLGAGTLQRS
jgi:isopenicillin-N epimerase